MIRRLLTLVSALSLSLFVATCMLWLRSYWVADTIGHDRLAWTYLDGYEDDCWWMESSRGRLYLFRGTSWTKPKPDFGWHRHHEPAIDLDFLDDEHVHRFVKFGFGGGKVPFASIGGTEAMVPVWLLCLLTLPLPAWRVKHAWHTRRRAAAGLCQSCGYDLRASKDRCPECGMCFQPTQ